MTLYLTDKVDCEDIVFLNLVEADAYIDLVEICMHNGSDPKPFIHLAERKLDFSKILLNLAKDKKRS